MNAYANYHERVRDELMEKARQCKAIIAANPDRRDRPQTRDLITHHVRSARMHNHLALMHRRKGEPQ